MRLSGPQIICTLGPACSNIERLREMARAGMTVLRVNEGAAGFMLTAETSVGQHPVAAIAFLRQMIERHGPR